VGKVTTDATPAATPYTHDEWIARVEEQARELAVSLRDASDAGVSHALILPRLVLVFRQSFGEPPAGFAIPGMPGLVP
jgi:hypothetical protein